MNLPHSNDGATGTLQFPLHMNTERLLLWVQMKCFSVGLLVTYSVAGPELGTHEHKWRDGAVLLSQSLDTAAWGSSSC